MVEILANTELQIEDLTRRRSGSGAAAGPVAATPDVIEPHLRSAQCFLTLGLGAEAAASWRRVLELDPGREGVAEIIRFLETPGRSGPGPN